jgi:hypothetical protein
MNASANAKSAALNIPASHLPEPNFAGWRLDRQGDAAPASGSLAAALWSVRTVIRHWTGEDVDMPPGEDAEDAASVAEDLQGYCPQGPGCWILPVLNVLVRIFQFFEVVSCKI